MFGFLVFYHVYRNLGEDSRIKILRNIFEIYDVSVLEISIREQKVIFRFFEMGVFYQYVFLLDVFVNELVIQVASSRRIFNCFVKVGEMAQVDCFDSFCLFLAIIQCQDENQIYRMIKNLL